MADLKRLEHRTREMEINYVESVASLRKEFEAKIKASAPQPQTPKPKPPTVAANPTRSNRLTEEQFNENLIRCSTTPPYGGIFDHTKLSDVGFDERRFGADQLDNLFAIKSREEMIADIVSLLQSPIRNVMSALEHKDDEKVDSQIDMV
jgi:hypothetical protein